jgi:sulfur-oxidizing protein SoxX
MRAGASLFLTVSVVGMFVMSNAVTAADAPIPEMTGKKPEMTGKQIAFDKSKGNCLACHAMPTVPDAVAAGTIGPPLIAMAARFPDKAKLRAQIWDATVANPQTSMIPFGKHKVLTEQEIDKVTDYIYSL